MSGRLNGKVAIVTGASGGLGAADARLFAAEGATVVLTDITDLGEQVALEIGKQAHFIRHDVTSEAAWIDLIAKVEDRIGRLDILVNNAGIVEVGTPESLIEADYRKVMAVSVDGTVFGCKHAIPAIRRSGGGSIINMGSLCAHQGQPNVAAYSAAKGAVDAYSRCVAVYCAQMGWPIRCNSVLPNYIVTPMVESMAAKRAAAAVSVALVNPSPGQNSPPGEPQDVGHLLVYLASDESRWISGQSFLVDNTASITQGDVPPRKFG